MSQEYKVGDVVQLKSGGPKMTVVSSTDESCLTFWFAGSKREHGNFAHGTLIRLEENAAK